METVSIEGLGDFEPVEITTWALDNDPEVPRSDTTPQNPDRPRYLWDQIMFVRDDLACRMFGVDKHDVFVVGTHSSKSVVLPVMYFAWGQIEFMMRYNYFDWCVSIRSPKLMDSIDFLELFDREQVRPTDFLGFPNDWVFDCLMANDYPLTSQFSFCVSTDYHLWTVLLLIRKWWGRRWAAAYGEPPIVVYDL